MEQFAERLSQLADLSDEDLGALETELVASFDAADADGSVESMQGLADALDQVRAQIELRAGGDTVEAAVAASGDETNAAADVADVSVEPVPEAIVPGTEAVDPAATPAAEIPKEDEVSDLTADEVPTDNQPVAVAAAATPIIRVGGDIPGYTAGAELDGMDAVVDAMTAKVNTMRGIGGDGEHVLVASIRNEIDIPDAHTLRPGDVDGNSRKIRELISDPEQLTPEALTAAGWCAPKAPIYDVPTIGTTDRPIKNALPTFNADRGGVTWMTPPSLAGVVTNDDATFAVWDKSTNKPCFTIPCGSEANAELEALTMCLCFDNMMSRAFPEWVRANTELTMVAQARWAEKFLLRKMWGTLAAGTRGTPDISLGVARDFLTALRVVASNFRWVNRLSPTAPLQLAAPSWLHDAIAGDLAIQAPGDNTLSPSLNEIDGYLKDINVQPIWYIDDLPTGVGSSATSTSASNFDSMLGFPQVAEWLLYPTGAFVRLDGGTLDLGVVRTKEDVQQNKYCEFSETFEAVAYMGPTGAGTWAFRGKTTINIMGAHPAAVSTAAGTIVEGSGS